MRSAPCVGEEASALPMNDEKEITSALDEVFKTPDDAILATLFFILLITPILERWEKPDEQ